MKKKAVKRKPKTKQNEGKQVVSAAASRKEALKLVRQTKGDDQLIVAYAKKGTTEIRMAVHAGDDFLMGVQHRILMNINPLVALMSLGKRAAELKEQQEG